MSYLLYTTIITEFAIPKRSIHSNFINGRSFIYLFSLPPFSFHTYSLFLLSIYYRLLFPTLTTHKYAHARTLIHVIHSWTISYFLRKDIVNFLAFIYSFLIHFYTRFFTYFTSRILSDSVFASFILFTPNLLFPIFFAVFLPIFCLDYMKAFLSIINISSLII